MKGKYTYHPILSLKIVNLSTFKGIVGVKGGLFNVEFIHTNNLCIFFWWKSVYEGEGWQNLAWRKIKIHDKPT
jgi:hypothetical protein